MKATLWFAASAALLVAGLLGSTRRLARAGTWLLLGSMGLALICAFFGVLRIPDPPLGIALWLRMLWTTLLMTVPLWVHFSYRFGRDPIQAGAAEKPALLLLWGGAAVLVFLGFSHPPLALNLELDRFVLQPPVGRWIAVHALAGLVIALWNFHATLETARIARRSRITHAIYAGLPLLVIGVYLAADLVLYREQPRIKTMILMPAAVLSSVGFVSAIGRRRLTEADLPVGRPVVYSSLVLTALGLLFVAMALIAELLRSLGVEFRAAWQEQISTGILIVVFALVILPGVRSAIRRFVDRNVYLSRFDYRTAWESINSLLAQVPNVEALAPALREYLRSTVGPVRVQVWLLAKDGRDFRPGPGDPAVLLQADHPLVLALENRHDPFILPAEASGIDEIPLLVACEELVQRHGLRIYFPLNAAGKLRGILGCGSGVGHSLHTEDIDLLRTVAAQVSTLIAATVWAGDERGSALPPGDPRRGEGS